MQKIYFTIYKNLRNSVSEKCQQCSTNGMSGSFRIWLCIMWKTEKIPPAPKKHRKAVKHKL